MNFLSHNPLATYTHWLHTRWPAGTVEPLPETGEDGATKLPGVRIVGDLTGIPLLKFSADTGARAVQAILREPDFAGARGAKESGVLDLVIIGGGVSGISAALEAKKAGLDFQVFESTEAFSTIVNFPKAKPIYTYPTAMVPAGEMQFHGDTKESLLAELHAQRAAAGIEPVNRRAARVERGSGGVIAVYHDAAEEGKGHQGPEGPKGEEATRALRVIIAIGRSGNYRRLGVPGEDLDKVHNRLFDPKDFDGKNVLVVGGGDSALETAIALTNAGGRVTLSYRGKEWSRPKPENADRIAALQSGSGRGSLAVKLSSRIDRITPDAVTLRDANGTIADLPNDVVFTMIGREAPLDFFRRSGLTIRNEWTLGRVAACLAFIAFCVLLYSWKSDHPAEIPLQKYVKTRNFFPYNAPLVFDQLGGAIRAWSGDKGNLLYTVRDGLGKPSFYYTLAYCTCVVVFGIRRIRRRKTPYVKWQTLTLMFMQCVPLFILPEIILPWMGRNGWFDQGHPLRWLADQLFEPYDGTVGRERAYWRSYGFILAWPLNVYNVFTDHPLWLWLGISFVQTFVIIPLIIWRWGKGAYCGWLCSCGALAETLGDAHRQKMPHGPFWNRLNMLGQGTLAFAVVILLLRILGWMLGSNSFATHWYKGLFESIPFLNYGWSVDILLGGIFGVGLYFWFSGRTWCRFACPLAALMHIYARFSRFRIFADKKKCISCNVCTSVCHQGIDVMSFANKGLPMEDPECVRCSACVQGCPTGVLSFGRYATGDFQGETILDRLPASPVLMAEQSRQVGH